MSFKWIFFDLDDTLFDFSGASLFSLRTLWDERHEIKDIFPTPESFIDKYHIHNSRMWDLHESGQISADFLQTERFRLTVWPEKNDDTTLSASRSLNDRYLHLLGLCNSPRPGADALLRQLSSEYLIGVLSNGFNNVQYCKLRSTGLDRYIQRVIVSEEIGIQKPDARLFRYAEFATGATPATTLMIGDNPKNDIQGALEAGWHAIYYDVKSRPFESVSPLFLGRITDLNEIYKVRPSTP